MDDKNGVNVPIKSHLESGGILPVLNESSLVRALDLCRFISSQPWRFPKRFLTMTENVSSYLY
jgi:hypothetical protein